MAQPASCTTPTYSRLADDLDDALSWLRRFKDNLDSLGAAQRDGALALLKWEHQPNIEEMISEFDKWSERMRATRMMSAEEQCRQVQLKHQGKVSRMAGGEKLERVDGVEAPAEPCYRCPCRNADTALGGDGFVACDSNGDIQADCELAPLQGWDHKHMRCMACGRFADEEGRILGQREVPDTEFARETGTSE